MAAVDVFTANSLVYEVGAIPFLVTPLSPGNVHDSPHHVIVPVAPVTVRFIVGSPATVVDDELLELVDTAVELELLTDVELEELELLTDEL